MITPQSGRALQRFADAMEEIPESQALQQAFHRFQRASLQLGHAFNAIRATLTDRQVAEKRRKQLKKDARKAL